MTKEIFANKSFGGKYSCSQEWNEDTYLQCGSSGLVIGLNPYKTAFFEAFPKKPATFIRGEGKTIEDAEISAWNKYQKILNCSDHSFIRFKTTDTAKCVLCDLNLTNYYPPLTSCAICSKQNVKNVINSKNYCTEHYLEQIENLNIIENFNNIENIFTKYIVEEKDQQEELDDNDFYYEEYLILKYALKNKHLEKMEDYEISNYIETMNYEFSILLRNIINNALNSEKNINEPVYLFTLNASIMKINSFLYNSEIIEKILKSLFEKEEFKDYELVKNHLKYFINEYRTKMPKEDCYRIIEKNNE